MEAFNLRKQAFILSSETHYPILTFPSEMIQLDQVSNFQTFIKSWSLLLTGISYESAMYETEKATQFLVTWDWSLDLGLLVTSLSHPWGLWSPP